MRQRIDIHCHAVAPGYRQYALDNGHEKPDGMPGLPVWTPEQHIALMRKLNISKSILSVSTPGTHLTPNDDEQAARMTHLANEELSAICAEHPSHFGFFASLPLPCVDASIAAIDHALDELGAVGFVVLSNANGVYLGDPVLDPVFAKLNARNAVVFIHPTTCNVIIPTESDGKANSLAVNPLGGYPRPMMEFMFDETRAIANLLLSGTVERFPNITFIMSHCGCTLPSILERIGGFATLISAQERQDGKFRELLRERFFFDLAGFPFPNQIHGLLRMLGDGAEEKLVYGSDYPFTPEKVVIGLARDMDAGCEELFDADQQNKVYHQNAKRLLGLDC